MQLQENTFKYILAIIVLCFCQFMLLHTIWQTVSLSLHSLIPVPFTVKFPVMFLHQVKICLKRRSRSC